ncbi:hypothetical protein Vi05172_g9253 [Venturia inaequalis]|nr:hypothetical protein Vi05172_g9253 [Venturia inaequalis]
MHFSILTLLLPTLAVALNPFQCNAGESNIPTHTCPSGVRGCYPPSKPEADKMCADTFGKQGSTGQYSAAGTGAESARLPTFLNIMTIVASLV